MKRYRICRWEEHQHYKDRTPTWIKLHRHLLTSYRYTQLPDATKSHYVGLLLLASEDHGEFVGDPDYLARILHATEPVDLDILSRAGLVEVLKTTQVVEPQTLHLPPQSDTHTDTESVAFARSREKRREEERREEDVSSLRSDTALAVVENPERWNDRLAPLCRQAGGEPNVANWLQWCRRMLDAGRSADELEEQIGGLVLIRDRGGFAWIAKGTPVKPAALQRLPMGERDQLAKAYRQAAT